jgi:hypothetical protein
VVFAVSVRLKFRPIYGTLGTRGWLNFLSAAEHIQSYLVWIFATILLLSISLRYILCVSDIIGHSYMLDSGWGGLQHGKI